MKTHALVILAVACFIVGSGFLAAGGEDDAIKKDRKQIAGTWRVISYEKDGKKTSAEQLEKTRTIYSADGKFMVQREGKTVIQGSTKIDPTKNPKQSEGTYTEGELKGMTVLGIYEIDGDNMRGCFALPGKDRPTEFSSKPGSGHVLITYKRDVPAKEKDKPKPFTNSIGMKFVWIRPGSFLMGNPKDEKKGFNEPLHRVTLTKGFYMGVFAVTQEEWAQVIDTLPSEFRGEKNLPVENVSWDECQAFIKELRTKDKKPYRLPTEAEWEYACRAGTKTQFHFGDTIGRDQVNYDCWYPYGNDKRDVRREKTTPVGTFPANAWGLHDMHGNVAQWCQDWYGQIPPKEVVDPQGPNTGVHRVLRGGSWGHGALFCRSAYRGCREPEHRSSCFGFRLCFFVE